MPDSHSLRAPVEREELVGDVVQERLRESDMERRTKTVVVLTSVQDRAINARWSRFMTETL